MDCYEKEIDFLDEKGIKRVVQGKRKHISMSLVTATQVKCSTRKRCMLIVAQFFKREEVGRISNDKDTKFLPKFPVVKHYADVFPMEVPVFPPHREIYFSIELVPGVAPIYKAPYRMSVPQLVELKL